MGMGAEEDDEPDSPERRGLGGIEMVGEDLVEEDPIENG